MGYLRYLAHLTTGTATGVGVAGQVNGSTLFMGNNSARDKDHVSAAVTVDAETDTLTLAAKWQASNNASTWFDIANAPQNPAAVVLATGTSGADAAVTKVIPAPDSVYGYKFARMSLAVAGTTGTDNDTFSVAYSYRQLDKGEPTEGDIRFGAHLLTGTATGIAPASSFAGNPVFMGGVDQRVEYLSALVTVDAETNTITLGAKWQGSNDKTTWLDIAHGPQNPAAVALATGTAGADAAVTKVVPAPAAVYGYKFARCAVLVGVVTGTSNDTVSIAYSYRQVDSGGGRE
jgi:hypothetical protein